MLYFCLDNLRSAYNVGSIFRTADAVGVKKIFLLGHTPLPLNAKLQKTALGSLDNVFWEHHCDALDGLTYLKSQAKFKLIALETDAQATSIFDFSFPKNTCLILGNEITGLSSSIISLSDSCLSIPQYGHKESLNVASAAAVAAYEFRRQHPIDSHANNK